MDLAIGLNIGHMLEVFSPESSGKLILELDPTRIGDEVMLASTPLHFLTPINQNP